MWCDQMLPWVQSINLNLFTLFIVLYARVPYKNPTKKKTKKKTTNNKKDYPHPRKIGLVLFD